MKYPSKIPRYNVEWDGGGEITVEPLDLTTPPMDEGSLGSVDREDLRLRARAVCDFIAGMTDRYAIAAHTNLFVPRGWNVEVLG